MAKLCMIKREKKRIIFEKRHSEKRSKLRAIVKSDKASPEDKHAAMVALQKLPRDSAKTRQSHRCKITGRARGVYRKVGLCRNMFRKLAMDGMIPGLKKASW